MLLENYTLYRLAIWLVRHLPRTFVYVIAGAIAELNFALNGPSRRGIYANYRRALPPEISRFARWRLARAAFRNFGYSVVDLLLIPDLRRERVGEFLAEVRGFEHVAAAQAAGKGGILMTAHMGSWELAGACLGLMGTPLTVAVLPHRDPRVNEIFDRMREAGKMEGVPVGGSMRRLVEALSKGRFVALVSDRDVQRSGPVVPFFGEPTNVPDGPARLSLRTGAWILPTISYRVRDFRIVIEIREPLIPDALRDTAASLTERGLRALECFIREHPGQWSSFMDLWDPNVRPVTPG